MEFGMCSPYQNLVLQLSFVTNCIVRNKILYEHLNALFRFRTGTVWTQWRTCTFH